MGRGCLALFGRVTESKTGSGVENLGFGFA